MVDWFRTWSKSIVVAVIIATILEMILPNSNSKKYVKIVIGIFVVYTILAPIMKIFSKDNINNIADFEKYINVSSNTVDDVQNNFVSKTEQSIKKIYIKNLQDDINLKLKNMGYIAQNINIQLSNNETYNIEKVSVAITEKLSTVEQEKQARTIVDNIKYIMVKVDSTNNNEQSVVDDYDRAKIKELIVKDYGVQNVTVNGR